MTEILNQIIFAALVAVIVLIFAGIAMNEKARAARFGAPAETEPQFVNYPPQYIGLTKFETVAKNLLAGVYQDNIRWQMIQTICRSGYRFSLSDDLSGLTKPIRADHWTLAHELADHGYVFEVVELQAIGNPATVDGTTVAHVMKSLGHIFLPSEVIALGNPGTDHGSSLANEIADQGAVFTFDEIIQLQNPRNDWGGTLAHSVAFHGQKFTVEQILTLGDASPIQGVTISLLMARNGHSFTVAEILRLKNPTDRFNATIGHWMARWGHRFSPDEILQLGNPVISYTPDDLLEYNIFDDRLHELSEDLEYQRKSNLLHNGATIAHIMAREGHRFTPQEIVALGNSRDGSGLSIADWMAMVDNPLSS